MADDARWYVVHTYSGYENIVAENIGKIVENRKMQDKILDVMIPMEKVVEVKDDKTVETPTKPARPSASTFPDMTLLSLRAKMPMTTSLRFPTKPGMPFVTPAVARAL